MELADAHEVLEVMGADQVDKALAEDWKLLAVVSATDPRDKTIRPCYVLGKKKKPGPLPNIRVTGL